MSIYNQTALGTFLFSPNPILTQEDCNYLISLEQKYSEKFEEGKAGETVDYRSVKKLDLILRGAAHPVDSGFLDHQVSEIIGNKIIPIIEQINGSEFKFEIDDVPQIELGVYAVGDHYFWHEDIEPVTAKRTRKLSFSINLNTDYDGGELKFGGREDNWVKSNAPGHIVVFPSYMTHKVSPVTSGKRYQVFGWATGPRFK